MQGSHEQVFHVQLFGNLAGGFSTVFVLNGTLARDYTQLADCGEPGRYGIGDAIGHVFVGFGAEVFERQHGQTGELGRAVGNDHRDSHHYGRHHEKRRDVCQGTLPRRPRRRYWESGANSTRQRIGKLGGRREAIIGLLGQRATHCVRNCVGNLGTEVGDWWRLDRKVLMKQRLNRVTLEDRPTGQHLVRNAPESILVGPCIDLASVDLLGAHVGGTSDGRTRHRERMSPGSAYRAGNPEIGDDRVPSRQENVVGLDVPMDDPYGVRIVQRPRDLPYNLNRLVDGQFLIFAQACPQRGALYIGHDIIEVWAGHVRPIRLARIVQGQDVWMLELCGYLDLPKETFGSQRGREFWPQHLDRNLAVVLQIGC